MTTNWGDIALNEMANRDENRLREARHLAKADHYQTAKPKRSLAGIIARAIRLNLTNARAESVTEPNLNLDTRQKPV